MPAARATTALADQPVFSNITVPGNLALALSVEFPTAVSVAHTDAAYSGSTSTYLGYFDTEKCYSYQYSAVEANRYFYPAGSATNHSCTSGKWSGNFLNWATMQTVDPFRWVLTGGYRVVDTASATILEKAWASGQGGTGNFPNRSISTSALIGTVTPASAWTAFNMRVQGLGNKMRFTATGNVDAAPVAYTGSGTLNAATVYEVSVRVKVCDSNISTAGPMEGNCTAYPSGNYKPTGLMQRYAEKIRYSAFGYLNDSSVTRDGGVLRAKQKFIGPTKTVPGQPPQANTDAAEWNQLDGTMITNPDSATASAFGVTVTNSGVMNYLNKFGQSGSYKTYDPVSELYYAAVRYYKNQGNVSAWSSSNGANAATQATWADGFPVITNWGNPVLYSCQKNFILGIGDVNTHADKNVPGNTGSANEPAKPAEVTADTIVDAVKRTNQVGVMQGGLGTSLGTTYPYNGCCTDNSALMAGLAYDANTKDILGRPETATFKKQTIKTYWLDILEFQNYKAKNQFYLAAKYGGFKVPSDFDPESRTADIDTGWWHTTAETVPNGDPRPDNYFTASRPDQMVSGLTRVFSSISDGLGAYTTSFGTALPQVAISGSTSYSAKYDPENWTGEIEASSVVFDAATGAPALTSVWTFSSKLAGQAGGTGWDTNRRIVTWNPANANGVRFRYNKLSSAQKSALDTTYRSGNDGSDYLDYLRGDVSQEEGSTVAGSSLTYRRRTSLVGDIVNSRVRPVGPPAAPYSDGFNPGYSAFKTAYATRPTMVYAGSNAGMLHAVNGALTGTEAGKEVFAYVPSAIFDGPTGTPDSNGLRSRGDPDFSHKPLVDGTPAIFDIDFGRTGGGTPGTPDWHSLLVGSLGKGGKSYYAIDVTDPAAMTTEAKVANKVLWEFTDADLGYTFGEPAAVKTNKYGWVLIFGSGYNNTGQGYFFIVNPQTGALLEKIGTGEGSASNQAGLAHVQAFVPDRTNFTADAAYAGDLLGNLWRLDLRPGPGVPYATPLKLAALTNAAGVALPITSRPLVVVHPVLNKRFVTVGTGRLLDNSDVLSTQSQGFFAVVDGNNNGFNTGPLPPGVSYPVQRANLVQLTDLTQKATIDFSAKMGWWIDLGTAAGGNGWRVVSDASSFFGVVTFAAMVPNGDACNPSGSSQVYSVDVGSGKSQLLNDAGDTVAYVDVAAVVTEHRTYSVNGVPRLIVSNDRGDNLALRRPPLTNVLRRLNWRELPLAN